MTDPILSINNLTVDLPKAADRAHAVENLSLQVMPKEIVCIVGESGSGKSITAFETVQTRAQQPARASHGDDLSGTDVGAEPLLYRG